MNSTMSAMIKTIKKLSAGLRLIGLIEKYPNSPQLKNFLTVAYHTQGNYIKAMEVNRMRRLPACIYF